METITRLRNAANTALGRPADADLNLPCLSVVTAFVSAYFSRPFAVWHEAYYHTKPLTQHRRAFTRIGSVAVNEFFTDLTRAPLQRACYTALVIQETRQALQQVVGMPLDAPVRTGVYESGPIPGQRVLSKVIGSPLANRIGHLVRYLVTIPPRLLQIINHFILELYAGLHLYRLAITIAWTQEIALKAETEWGEGALMLAEALDREALWDRVAGLIGEITGKEELFQRADDFATFCKEQ